MLVFFLSKIYKIKKVPFKLPIYKMCRGQRWRLAPALRRNLSEAEWQSSPYSRSREQCQTIARAVATLLSLSCASKLVFVPIPATNKSQINLIYT